jgi:hypothetical protein
MRNLALSRGLGALAIALLPTFVLFGWWMLAIAAALAFVADRVRPRPTTHGHRGRLRHAHDAVRRRLRRHSWRPGNR